MARHRTPQQRAQISGATLIHPERFRDRRGPTTSKPVGQPYAGMTEPEKTYWNEFAQDLPWLKSSHRVLLRMTCRFAARLDAGELGVSGMHALSSLLSKLGATPVDAARVIQSEDQDEDEGWFTR